ncbi:UNVERIFIED_CONTAM: hypothetical protein PYX00_005041 [Menopon gallinae]|uniref:Uncharacterized protein n=1 Tax=Menopon gallinae TaxID=328185 RepID=A0AAW2I6B1_9NEOP
MPIRRKCQRAIPKTLHNSTEALRLPYGTFLQREKGAVINKCRIARKFLNLPAYSSLEIPFRRDPNSIPETEEYPCPPKPKKPLPESYT